MDNLEQMLSNYKKSEYIICAAVLFKDGEKHKEQPQNIDNGFVVCGRRHHNCYITLWLLNGRNGSYSNLHEGNDKAVEGFLTSKDRFVDRKEGGEIAFREKQTERITDCLFSEDLY